MPNTFAPVQEGKKFSLQSPARKVSGGSWKIHYLAERWCGICGWSPQVALSANASLSPSYNWAPLRSPSCQAPAALSRVSEIRGAALAVGSEFLGQECLTYCLLSTCLSGLKGSTEASLFVPRMSAAREALEER